MNNGVDDLMNETPRVQQPQEQARAQEIPNNVIPSGYLSNSIHQQDTASSPSGFLDMSETTPTAFEVNMKPLDSQQYLESTTSIRDWIFGVAHNGEDSVHDPPPSNKSCGCMVCLRLGTMYSRSGMDDESCRFPGCHNTFDAYSFGRAKHEKEHFGAKGKFRCIEPDCGFKSPWWGTLLRHYTSKHCDAPQRYPCPIVGCKYGGENGFKRPDKCQSHINEKHRGMSRVRKTKSGGKQKPRDLDASGLECSGIKK